MARLDQLTDGFMESFLRNNPKSVVDSNGYLRSEYEEELARRAAIKAQPQVEGVPDPRSFQPQFQDIPEFEPAVDALFDAPVAEPVSEPAVVDLYADFAAKLAEMTPVVAADPEVLKAAQPVLGEDQKYAVVPDEIQSATPLEAGLAEPELYATSDPTDTAEPDGADVHNDHE